MARKSRNLQLRDKALQLTMRDFTHPEFVKKVLGPDDPHLLQEGEYRLTGLYRSVLKADIRLKNGESARLRNMSVAAFLTWWGESRIREVRGLGPMRMDLLERILEKFHASLPKMDEEPSDCISNAAEEVLELLEQKKE